MISTTLRQIRQHSPCSSSWRTLLAFLGKTGIDDEPLPLTTILRSNGLDDALWCLRTLEGHDKEIIRFALACVQEVSHLMTDKRSLDVLSALERHLEIPLSKRELDQVVAEAWAAVAEAWAARAAASAEAAAEAAWTAAQVTVWTAAEAAAEAAWTVVQATAWSAWAAARTTGTTEAEWAAARSAARARQTQIFEGIFG